jgi:heme-binding protein
MQVWLRRILWGVFAGLVVAQITPTARSNPPVESAETMFPIIPVPPNIVDIFRRSCQDCHSNQTAWPWYSRVAPMSWFLVHHVNQGRSELNVSEWERYTARRKDRRLKEISDQVASGKLPILSYTLMHPGAKLAVPDRKALCEWADAARRKLAASNTAGLGQLPEGRDHASDSPIKSHRG